MKREVPTKLRIWLKRPGDRRASKKFVLVAPPFPEIGDVVTIQGFGWIVTRTQDASDAIEIRFPSHARQVFP